MLGVLPWIVASLHQHCCSKTTNSKTNSVYFNWRVNLSNLASKRSVLAPHTQWDTVAFRERSGDLLKIFFPQYCSKQSFQMSLFGVYFWPFPKVCRRLTYGSNPVCPRPPFLAKQCEWVGSNCHCRSAAVIPPNELSCQSCFSDLHRRP